MNTFLQRYGPFDIYRQVDFEDFIKVLGKAGFYWLLINKTVR